MAHLYYGVKVPKKEWLLAYLKKKMSEEKQNGTDGDSRSITSKYTTNKYLIDEIKEYEKRDDSGGILYLKELKEELANYTSRTLEEEISYAIENYNLAAYDIYEDTCDEYEDQLGCSFFRIQHIISRGADETWYYYGVHWTTECADEIDPVLPAETKAQIDSLIMEKFNQKPCYCLEHETYYL